jgi:hypothetical protein
MSFFYPRQVQNTQHLERRIVQKRPGGVHLNAELCRVVEGVVLADLDRHVEADGFQ